MEGMNNEEMSKEEMNNKEMSNKDVNSEETNSLDNLSPDESIIVLIDEEGVEHEFEVLDILELEDAKYAVLLPLIQENEDEEEAVLMKFGIDDDGEEVLFDILNDDEWAKVAAAYEAIDENENE